MQYEKILQRKAMFKTGVHLSLLLSAVLAILMFFQVIPYSSLPIFLLFALFILLVYCGHNYDQLSMDERMTAPIWHYRQEDRNIGPLSLSDIRPLISSGVIANETPIWKEGTKKWSIARSVWPEYFKSIPPTPSNKFAPRGKGIQPEDALVQQFDVPRQKCGLAIASLVCGIIGGAFSTASIPAVICGHMALSHIKKDPESYGGKRMAIAGLILGYIAIVLALILGTMRGILWEQLRQMGY